MSGKKFDERDVILQLYDGVFEVDARENMLSGILEYVGGSGVTWFARNGALSKESFFGYVGHSFDVNAYLDYFFEIDDWHRQTQEAKNSDIMHLSEEYNMSQFRESEFLNDFCLPEIRASSILCANTDPATNSHLSIYRGKGEPVFDEAALRFWSDLLPHLRNWRRLFSKAETLRANLEYAEKLNDAFDAGIAIVTGRGRIKQLNRTFDEVLRRADILCDRNGYLMAKVPGVENRLRSIIDGAVKAAEGNRNVDGARSFGGGGVRVLTGSGGFLNIVVAPWRGRYEAGRRAAEAIVLAIDDGARPRSERQVLSSLFGLTKAEAEVADLMLLGIETTGIAERRGTAVRTTRNQMKSILAKAECRRQTDFVRQVARLFALLPGRGALRDF